MTDSNLPAAGSAGLRPVPVGVVCLDDYEREARACMPHAVFEYFASGSGDEQTMLRNRNAFTDYEIVPRVMRDMTGASTALRLFDEAYRHPILLGPVAH